MNINEIRYLDYYGPINIRYKILAYLHCPLAIKFDVAGFLSAIEFIKANKANLKRKKPDKGMTTEAVASQINNYWKDKYKQINLIIDLRSIDYAFQMMGYKVKTVRTRYLEGHDPIEEKQIGVVFEKKRPKKTKRRSLKYMLLMGARRPPD